MPVPATTTTRPGTGGIDPAAVPRRPGCPKRMAFGPCGGVRPDGGCEVDGHPCPFVAEAAPAWPVPDRLGDGAPPPGRHPLVLVDARPAEPTLAAARDLARTHAGWADAVLLGDHHERIDLPAPLLAAVAIDEGSRPWVTLSCRDRNAVALEADLAACAELGVAGVHCVTGDARAPHVRPGTTPVFDLDGLRLTALARTFGLTVSVAESPLAVPTERRPRRALDKWRAGASWCFVNVGVGAAQLAAFVDATRRLGAALRFIACVPVFTDEDGARRLQSLPGVGLADHEVAAVVRAARPVEAGVARAVARARRCLAVAGVEGVDLSGPASTRSPAERVAVMRAVAEALR